MMPMTRRIVRRCAASGGGGPAVAVALAWLSVALSGVAAAGTQPAPLQSGASTTPDLCAAVLRRLTGTTRPIRNVVHTDYQPFVLSKPQIDPLETLVAPFLRRGQRFVFRKPLQMGGLLFYVHSGVKANGLTSAEFALLRPLAEAWVQRGQFKPEALNAFGTPKPPAGPTDA